eukprot:2434958-Pleurochrysis_carterae.AAC.1
MSANPAELPAATPFECASLTGASPTWTGAPRTPTSRGGQGRARKGRRQGAEQPSGAQSPGAWTLGPGRRERVAP